MKFKMIITQEPEEVIELEENEYVIYYGDVPWEGEVVETLTFETVSEYREIVKKYEGYYYQLFIDDDELIGYGTLDHDSPIEDIAMKTTCYGNCNECFWLEAYNHFYVSSNKKAYMEFWNKYKPIGCFWV